MCLALTNSSKELGTLLQFTFLKISLLCLEICVDSKLIQEIFQKEQADPDLPVNMQRATEIDVL